MLKINLGFLAIYKKKKKQNFGFWEEEVWLVILWTIVDGINKLVLAFFKELSFHINIWS